MTAFAERHVELPDPERSSGSVVWHLTQRGLEWEGGQSRAAWMPFACMRRITLGSVSALGGWRMRVAGPPGNVIIGASHYRGERTSEADRRFRALATDVIREAGQRGCPPKFRLNDRYIAPAVLWARLGHRAPDYRALLARLALSPK